MAAPSIVIVCMWAGVAPTGSAVCLDSGPPQVSIGLPCTAHLGTCNCRKVDLCMTAATAQVIHIWQVQVDAGDAQDCLLAFTPSGPSFVLCKASHFASLGQHRVLYLPLYISLLFMLAWLYNFAGPAAATHGIA